MRGQRPRQQPHGLLDLPESAFGQPALVQRVAAKEVVPQGASGPDPELGATQGLDPVADRDDDVEAEVLYFPGDRPAALGSNLCKFCTGCRGVQLALPERVPDVLGDDRALPPEQLGHLRLGQPDRLPLEAHVHPDLAVRGLVDDHLTARRSGHHPVLRA
jgi:hypothetical protein